MSDSLKQSGVIQQTKAPKKNQGLRPERVGIRAQSKPLLHLGRKRAVKCVSRQINQCTEVCGTLCPFSQVWRPEAKAGLVRPAHGLREDSRRLNEVGRGHGRWETGGPMG